MEREDLIAACRDEIYARLALVGKTVDEIAKRSHDTTTLLEVLQIIAGWQQRLKLVK